jgi:hypothetical protein
MTSISPARVGVSLILAGLLWIGGWNWWKSTRNWRPLDVPISMTAKDSLAAEFDVNIEADYLIGVAVNHPGNYQRVQCLFGVYRCDDVPSNLRAGWTVKNRQGPVASGHSESIRQVFVTEDGIGVSVGRVHLPKGRYIVQIDDLEVGHELAILAPRLMVIGNGDVYWFTTEVASYIWIIFFACLAAGLCLILHSDRETSYAFARANPLTQPGPQLPLPGSRTVPSELAACRRFYARIFTRVRHAPMKAPFQWPCLKMTWAWHITAVPMLLLVPVMYLAYSETIPVGLRIRLLRPGIALERSPGIQPLHVHVGADHDLRPNVTVDSRPVPWDDLAVVLRREIWRRPPDWPVYVDGDLNMPWGNAVLAMDVIRGLGAQVVLLTPEKH